MENSEREARDLWLSHPFVSYDSEDHIRIFNSIGYLFSGYNLINGNPFSEEGIDSGFTIAPIFTTEYNGRSTGDGLTLLPKGVNAYRTISCQIHTH